MTPDHGRRHIGSLVAVCLLALVAFPVNAQNRWDEMDYGPFLSSSVTMPGANPEDPAGIVEKGFTVRLGTKDHPAAVCFDTDLVCYRAGWTGGWLKLMGTPFDGTHRPPEGSRPMPHGETFFVVEDGPGLASPEGRFEDPRVRPYGPLPALSADSKTVTLELADHQPSMQLLTKCNLESADGTPVEVEIFSTVNRVPAGR